MATLQKNNACGALFENWVISEIRKNNFNTAQNEGMYYFRDSTGNEVDLISERDGELMAIEIKAGSKTDNHMFLGLKYSQKYQPSSHCVLVYGGNSNKIINDRMSMVPWSEVASL